MFTNCWIASPFIKMVFHKVLTNVPERVEQVTTFIALKQWSWLQHVKCTT